MSQVQKNLGEKNEIAMKVFFAPTDGGRPPYTFLRPPLPPWPPDNDRFCFSLNRSKMSLSALLSLLAVMALRLSLFSHPEPTPALFTQYPSMKMFHITPIYPCTYTNIPQCIISENLILTTASRQAAPTGFQSSITSLNISQSPVIPLFSPLTFPTHMRTDFSPTGISPSSSSLNISPSSVTPLFSPSTPPTHLRTDFFPAFFASLSTLSSHFFASIPTFPPPSPSIAVLLSPTMTSMPHPHTGKPTYRCPTPSEQSTTSSARASRQCIAALRPPDHAIDHLSMTFVAQVTIPVDSSSSPSSAPPDHSGLHQIIRDSVLSHYGNHPGGLTLYFEPSRISAPSKIVSPTPKNPNTTFYYPITVSPHEQDDHPANADDFLESVTRFLLQRLHLHGPGILPTTAAEARKQLTSYSNLASTHPWTPHVLFLPQPCNAYPEKPHGLLLGLPPTAIRNPDDPSTAIAALYRIHFDILRHVHTQLAPHFVTSDSWRLYSDFRLFHHLCGVRSSTYYSPNNKSVHVPALYLCSPYPDCIHQLAHFVATKKITLSVYGLTIAITPFPPKDNLTLVNQTIQALTKTATDFASLDRFHVNRNDIEILTVLRICLPSPFTTADYADVCSSRDDIAALIPVFSLDSPTPTFHQLVLHTTPANAQHLGDASYFLPTKYRLPNPSSTTSSSPYASSATAAPASPPTSTASFNFAFAQLSGSTKPSATVPPTASNSPVSTFTPGAPPPYNVPPSPASKRSRSASSTPEDTSSYVVSPPPPATSTSSLRRAANVAPTPASESQPMDTDDNDSSRLQHDAVNLDDDDSSTDLSADLLDDSSADLPADSEATTLDDPNTQTTTTSTASTTLDDSSDYADDSFMTSLQHSQPLPRPQPRTLPQDIIDELADPSLSAELEVLLQDVPDKSLDDFYKLARLRTPSFAFRDYIIPSWVAALASASVSHTKP